MWQNRLKTQLSTYVYVLNFYKEGNDGEGEDEDDDDAADACDRLHQCFTSDCRSLAQNTSQLKASPQNETMSGSTNLPFQLTITAVIKFHF